MCRRAKGKQKSLTEAELALYNREVGLAQPEMLCLYIFFLRFISTRPDPSTWQQGEGMSCTRGQEPPERAIPSVPIPAEMGDKNCKG